MRYCLPLFTLFLAACNNIGKNVLGEPVRLKDSAVKATGEIVIAEEDKIDTFKLKDDTYKRNVRNKKLTMQANPALMTIPQDTTLISGAGVTTSFIKENDSSEASEPMGVYLRRLFSKEVPPETFELPVASEKTFITKAGTAITINASDLITATGSPVTKSVHIEVTEMSTPADMLKMFAPTVSNGEMLESGGSWLIKASSDGQIVKVKPGKSYKITLPGNSFENFNVFYGSSTADSSVNWNVSPANFFALPYLNAWVYSTDYKFRRHLNKSDKNTPTGKAERIYVNQSWVITATTVEKYFIKRQKLLTRQDGGDGEKFEGSEIYLADISEKDIRFLKKFSQSCSAIDKVVDSRFSYESGFLFEAEDKNKSYQLIIDSTALTDKNELLPKEIKTLLNQKVVLIKDKTVDKFRTTKSVQSATAAYVTSFGWINCDKFYKSRERRMNYYASVSQIKSVKTLQPFLLFKSIKSLLPGHISSNGSIVFENIPEGKEVKCIVLAGTKDGIMVGNTDYFKLGTNEKIAFVNLEKKTDKQIKSLLNNL